MAAKNIFKFFLKLIVAAGIVAGAYFGISALINSKDNSNQISTTSQGLNIVANLQNSGQSLASKSDYNTSAKLLRLNDITNVLIDYYNHYVNLSSFENHSDNSAKEQIISKIKELDQKIKTTQNSLTLIDSSSNDTVKKQRIQISAGYYINQTQAFFELDELLKDYVYKVNYNVSVSGIVYEAQLEMMKDYCKAMFDEYIVKAIGDTSVLSNLLVDKSNQTNFLAVLQKYFNKQELNVNSDTEVHFAWYYMNIDKSQLNGFYKLNHIEKSNYKNSFSETEKKYFDNLYNYLNGQVLGGNE